LVDQFNNTSKDSNLSHWAEREFAGAPHARPNNPSKDRRRGGDEPLKSNDNPEHSLARRIAANIGKLPEMLKH
jgi:hypothetical protein